MAQLVGRLVFPLGGFYSFAIIAPAFERGAVLAGLLDQLIDPITLDYIDEDDGTWSETPDSRSIVMCQLELELGGSYSTPGDGTAIAETMRRGDPVTPQFVEAEIRRALGVLEAIGTIGTVNVNWRDGNGDQLVDQAGRAAFEISWTDLATGSPVAGVYSPMGG